jgi:hypothetical protein
MGSLLDQFFAQDATPSVCQLIHQVIVSHETRRGELYRCFNFNRFDVTVNFVERVVLIEDVLTPDESGQARVPLNEFVDRLSR